MNETNEMVAAIEANTSPGTNTAEMETITRSSNTESGIDTADVPAENKSIPYKKEKKREKRE